MGEFDRQPLFWRMLFFDRISYVSLIIFGLSIVSLFDPEMREDFLLWVPWVVLIVTAGVIAWRQAVIYLTFTEGVVLDATVDPTLYAEVSH